MSRVVLTGFDKDVERCLGEALRLIRIDDLNARDRSAVVKVGVFSRKTGQYTTVNVIDALVGAFDRTPKIYLLESDSYGGPATKRLGIWEEVFSERVIPFSLSTDKNTREVKVAGEKVAFSHVVFKPNVFVSTHVPRRYQHAGNNDLMNMGSILKNLLGLIPDRKKYRFHEKLHTALLDMYEAIGGIDLAVLDGTYTHLGVKRKRNRIQTNMLVVGRDAISVEAVGAYLVGRDPLDMPLVEEAMNRGLGQGDMDKIEILGSPVEDLREEIVRSFRQLFPKKVKKEEGWI